MKKVNRYEFDGEAIEVPVCWDRHLRRYVEDCTAYCEQPGYKMCIRDRSQPV